MTGWRESPQPRFIVVEGLDGTGKSSVCRQLAHELDAILLGTPQAGLLDVRSTVENVFGPSSVARTLFYAACVVQASDEAGVLLAAGRSVVLDRYLASTLSYANITDRLIDLRAVEASIIPAKVRRFDADSASTPVKTGGPRA